MQQKTELRSKTENQANNDAKIKTPKKEYVQTNDDASKITYWGKTATGVPMKAQGTCPQEDPQVGQFYKRVTRMLACQDTLQTSTHD